MVTREQVFEVLKDCYDPEIPINLVDLGLIYDVQVNEQGKVAVKMTLTTQGCCMGDHMSQDAQSKILALPGVTEAAVELVWDPPWDPSRMSADAKKQLGFE